LATALDGQGDQDHADEADDNGERRNLDDYPDDGSEGKVCDPS
jgi:hypothetical protein